MGVKIEICKSCMKDCDHRPKNLVAEVQELLEARWPDVKIKVESTSCLKVCPRRNVAFSLRVKKDGEVLQAVRSIGRKPDAEGISDEVVSLVDQENLKRRSPEAQP